MNTGGIPTGMDAVTRLNQGIDKMNDMLDLMLDVFEKRSRQHTPTSMYAGRHRTMGRSVAGFDFQGLKQFNELTSDELKEFSDGLGDVLDNLIDNLSREIDALNTKIAAETDAAKKAELIEKRDKLDEKVNSAVNDKTNVSDPDVIRRRWETERHEPAVAKAKDEYGGATPEQMFKYKSDVEAYQEKTERLNNASTAIAHSGLGNTALGRTAQNALNRQQNMSSLGNFGNMLNNPASGQAASIGQSLFGMGKAGKAATSMLSGFGKGLSKISNIFGGPLLTALSFLIDALKAAAEAYNEWQKLTAEFIRYQTEMEKIAYEEEKQKRTLETEISVEKINYMGEMALKALETQSENLLELTDIQLKAMTKSFEIGTGALTKGVNQTAYDAASAAIEHGAATQKYNVHQELRERQLELFGNKRSKEAEQKIASSTADMYVAEVNAEAQRITAATNLENKQIGYAAKAGSDLTSLNLVGAGANALMAGRNAENNTTTEVVGKGNVNPVTGKAVDVETYKAHGVDKINDVRTSSRAMIEAAVMGAFGSDASGMIEENAARVENATEQLKRDADYIKVSTDLQYKKELAEISTQTALAEKQADVTAKMAEKQIEAAEAIQKNWLAVTQAIEEWQSKFEKTFNDISQNIGMNNRGLMMNYQQSQFALIKSVAESFGMTDEDVAAIQKGYTDNTGRNGILSKMDMRQLAALGTNMGDTGIAAQYASEMDIFNHSVEESVDLLGDALNKVNRIGLNGRKYTKDVVANLKLAQKYNFKGGIQGFMNMARWAEKTRFNIASIGSMVDKVQEGGLEGVITQSAGFQVLGGHAAMNSDPLGMMFDAWADPEAYAKRMQDMTKGFGTVDRKTGETKFNINESMQMAQIAKLQGRSVEEVRGEVMDRNKRDFIKNNLTAEQKRNLSEEEKDYLGTVAKYNANTQRYEAKIWDEGQKAYVARDVNELTAEDLKNVMPEDHQERMETWVSDIASAVKKMDAEKIWESADVASATYKQTLDSFNTRLNEMHTSYLNTREEAIKNIGTMQNTIENSVKGYLEQYANNLNNDSSAVAGQMTEVKNAANDIAGTLETVADLIADAGREVGQELADLVGEENIRRNYPKLDDALRATDVHVEAHASVRKDRNKADVESAETRGLRNSPRDPRNLTPKEFVEKYVYQIPVQSTNDAVVSGKGEPLAMGARKVVPINDGVLAMGRSDDSALVKAPNREVDNYLNGLGAKIMGLYDVAVKQQKTDGSVLPDSARIMDDSWNEPSERVSRENRPSDNFASNQPQNMNLKVSGSVMLECDGQQINIIEQLKNDPIAIRKFTEMLSYQFSSNANGGKYNTLAPSRFTAGYS